MPAKAGIHDLSNRPNPGGHRARWPKLGGRSDLMREFPASEELANSLAEYVAKALRSRLARDGVAALAVSGGTTPVKFFHSLSKQSLDWRSISVTLVDDRWVPETSGRSNAALVKQHLLQGQAACARFLPLVNSASTPEAGKAYVEAAIRSLPLPFSAVVLGMGIDGHTASFFPGGDRLTEALWPSDGQLVESMRAVEAIEPRITLTLPILLEAEHVAVHIEGDEKRKILDIVYGFGTVEENPVLAVLQREPEPEIFWCP